MPPPRATTFISLPGLPGRSLGLKFLLVCVLALAMVIPTFFVQGIAFERSQRAGEVASELGGQTGGRQSVSGPVLLVPYTRPTPPGEALQAPAGPEAGAAAGTTVAQPRAAITRGWWVFFPDRGEARATLAVSTRQRSIYKVPTFLADTAITTSFDMPAALASVPEGVTFDWASARLLGWVGDLRGVKEAMTITLDGGAVRTFEPSTGQAIGSVQVPAGAASADGVAPTRPVAPVLAPVGGLIGPDTKASMRMSVKLTGAERFALVAFAQDTAASIGGNWASPKFEGAFLASDRRVGQELSSEAGEVTRVDAEAGTFEASWRAPFLARGLPRSGALGPDITLEQLGAKDFAVTLVQRSEVYSGVQRALRYALLFVGTVFLAFFLFEAMGGPAGAARAHPAQYLLVGLAQSVFYLLLLAFAEQTGFDLAFLLAAVPTVLLASGYAASVFGSRTRGLQALAAFSAVYGLMYVLMTLEDQALLAGALTAFAAIAAVMRFTRKVNWYGDRTAADRPMAD
jgi:inner membrane protein